MTESKASTVAGRGGESCFETSHFRHEERSVREYWSQELNGRAKQIWQSYSWHCCSSVCHPAVLYVTHVLRVGVIAALVLFHADERSRDVHAELHFASHWLLPLFQLVCHLCLRQ